MKILIHFWSAGMFSMMKCVVVCGLLFILFVLPMSARHPWQHWNENPIIAELDVTLRAEGQQNFPIEVSLGYITNNIAGAGCTTLVTNNFKGDYKFYRAYKLTVQGTGVDSFIIDILAKPALSVIDSSHPRRAFPKGFKVLVNNQEYVPISIDNEANPCGTYSNSWVIEVRRDANPNWRVDDDTDEGDKVMGQGSWLSVGPGKSGIPRNAMIDWNVDLGNLYDGNTAGKLRIQERTLTSTLFTPNSIFYTAKSTNVSAQVELVSTNLEMGTLRQVKAPQAFVDILPGTNQYSMAFYASTNVGPEKNGFGVYTNITGNPFLIWRVQNPDGNPGISNRLYIIEERYGTGGSPLFTRTNLLAYDSTNLTWTLTTGSGADTRVEIRSLSFGTAPSGRSNRIEIVTVKYSGGAVVYKTKEEYEEFSWGWELTKTINDPDGVSLTTQFAYYVNDAAAEQNGKLKYIIYPDGFWEKRIYTSLEEGQLYWIWDDWYIPGFLRYILNPLKDAPSHPDGATLENSAIRKFQYYGSSVIPAVNVQFTDFNSSENTYKRLHVEIFYVSYESCPEGNCPEGNLRAIQSGTGRNSLSWRGTVKYTFTEDAPRGLADHLYYIEANSGEEHHRLFYYDHGIFNFTSNTFILNPTNHLYSANPSLTIYPDRRVTIVHLPKFFWDDELIDHYDALEDHGISTGLLPKQSWKETQILCNGNVIATEMYVYVGCSNDAPIWELLQKNRHYLDSLGRPTNIVRIDGGNGTGRVLQTADYRGTNGYDGEQILSATDETGVQTSYTYDSLKRLKTVTHKGVSASGGFAAQADRITTYVYDAAGRTLKETRSAGSLSFSTARSFDVSSRLLNETNEAGLVTITGYSSDNRSVFITLPTGGTKTNTQYLDRRPKGNTGTAQIPVFFDYSADLQWFADFVCYRYTSNFFGSVGSPRWKTEGVDGSDMVAKLAQPASGGGEIQFDRFSAQGGIVEWEGTNGLPITVFRHNPYGGRHWVQIQPFDWTFSQGLPMMAGLWDARNILVYDYFFKTNDIWYRAVTNFVTQVDGSETLTFAGSELEQLNGFLTNEISRTLIYDADTNQTSVAIQVDLTAKIVKQITDTPQSSLNATNLSRNGLFVLDSTSTVSKPTLYFYDDLGRTNRIQTPQGFNLSMQYDTTTGYRISSSDLFGNVTTYEYYQGSHTNAGQLKCITEPNQKKTYYGYTLRGELQRVWGNVPYPLEYKYSIYGELTNLVTFRNGGDWNVFPWPTGNSGDNTYWIYDEGSGELISKADAQGRLIDYSYNSNGQLATRSWQRTVDSVRVTSTNTYDSYGDLVKISYTDGTLPVAFTNGSSYLDYNRVGLPRMAEDSSGIHIFTYDHANRLIRDACISGTFNGLTISNRYNKVYGVDQINVLGLGSSLVHAYYFDTTYGRLNVVSNGIYSATYDYSPHSDLVQTTTFKNNGVSKLATTRTWEYGARLRSIANAAGSTIISSHTYDYDQHQRKTRTTQEDTSSWIYDYNGRNELILGKRVWDDQSPVSGQQFEYAYDNIGNRINAKSGGDINGANLRSTGYSVDSLNQYTSITNLGYEDIFGVAWATAAVTVDTGVTDRKGEYYHREIGVSNGSGPVWQSVTVNPAPPSGSGTNLLFPKNIQSLSYDLDGNLTFDGIWTYSWDAENRLKAMSMTNVSGIPDAQRKKLSFTYDYVGRRSTKTVGSWNGTDFGDFVTNKFIYNGWNLIAEINGSNTLLRSYLWGQDLSGTQDEAGGIGGLLLVADHVPITDTFHFPSYDGNGNVIALVNASDQTISARYEYSPFGETLRSTGPQAISNPFRFSTKFTDEESNLIYYGYRYYSTAIGRWINRDPIEEEGGYNLYAALLNAPVNQLDSDGRKLMFTDKAKVLLAIFASILSSPGEGKMIKVGSSRSARQIAARLIIESENKAKGKVLNKSHTGSSGGVGGGGPPKGTYFSPKGWAALVSVVVVSLEATANSLTAAANVALGNRSEKGSGQYALESAMLNYNKGETAYGDLDAIEAALLMYGGGTEAFVAWDTFSEAGEAFQ